MLAGMIEELQAVDVDAMTRPRLEAVIAELQALESAATSRRMAAMAALDSLGDGGRSSASVARSDGKASAKKARSEQQTASALSKMPKTRRQLDQGSITPEHAKAAADAANRCGDPGKADDELSDRSDVPADLFAKRSKDWADDHNTQAEIDARAKRQHRDRRASFGRSSDDGSWVLFARGTTADGRELQGLIDAETDRLFRDDGGRDNPTRHRTDDQRRFDALANLIRRGAGHEARPGKRPHPKYQGIVTIPLSAYLNPDEAEGTLVGSGPLPRAIVQRILCDGELMPLIVDDHGQPLFAGRTIRTANDAQWKALTVRNGGCVVCGADPSRCEAHHLIWWERSGGTDITNLVLLCTHHHHELHDHDLLLSRTNGEWRLTPRAGPRPHPTTRTPRPNQRSRRNRQRRTAPARAPT
ncbi:MAG: HNH endonuclease [Actinomycetota bacterium]